MRKANRLLFLYLLLAGFLLLNACRDQSASGGAGFLATLTPTPRSTPLPAVPTAVPIGSEANPLQMVIRPEGSVSAARNALPAFESAILEKSGIAVRVQLVERYAEALAALCGSTGTQASVAWLNGVTYMAAEAQNCGQAVLQVERGQDENARTGEGTSLIVNRDVNINSVSALNRRSFCRLGFDDFYTWLAPMMLLKASGLNPVTAVESVSDYDDLSSLVRAVAAGECDAAGIPETSLEQYADDLGDALEEVEVLTTTIAFPYAVLVMPPEVPLGRRLALDNALLEMAESGEAVTMRVLLGQNALLPVTGEEFTEMADFIASTGLDLAQLGE